MQVVKGGDSRQDSVGLALQLVPTDTELVLVHDAVRPFVTVQQITRVIDEARRCKAAILGIPAMDTVKEVKRASLPEDVALITATVPRERVVLAQTPQVFDAKLLKEAFAQAATDGVNASDEAGLIEKLGHDVHVVLGAETQYQDYQARGHGPGAFLPAIRAEKGMSIRCGIGYDLHRLAEGRKLIVGGMEVAFREGSGWAIRTAMSWRTRWSMRCWARQDSGDIGTHFPDSDPKWKGANSLIFLEHTRKLLDENKFLIEHIDAIVILEKPKLGPHFPKMSEILAKALRRPSFKVHLKAKTNETVDAVGRGEAIAAHVIATLYTP